MAQDAPPSILTSRTVHIVPLEGINTKELEYAPVIMPDGTTLFFVSDRPGSVARRPDTQSAEGSIRHTEGPALRRTSSILQYSHDVWVARKRSPYDSTFIAVHNLDTSQPHGIRSINTHKNEGATSVSADGTAMFVVACKRNEKDNYGDCDIYMSKRASDSTWGPLVNLGEAVNSAFWDSQPCIAPDFSRLYFTSNRPGGVPVADSSKEGAPSIDIWYSDYDPVLQRFKPAVNAGTVLNTPGQEFSPFICADSRTLVFASNAHSPNLGGMDFYYSTNDGNGQWSSPTHIDAPISSSEDDAFASVAASGDLLYFSSKRVGDNGKPSYDIFMVVDDNALHRSGNIAWNTSAPSVVLRIYAQDSTLVRQLTVEKKQRQQASASVPQEAHRYYTVWDATDSRGIKVPAGTYSCDIIARGKKVETTLVTVR